MFQQRFNCLSHVFQLYLEIQFLTDLVSKNMLQADYYKELETLVEVFGNGRQSEFISADKSILQH